MSEKYTSFNGWYDAEQERYEASEAGKQRQQAIRERRKRYIAEDAMRLSARFAPRPETTTPNPIETPQSAEVSTDSPDTSSPEHSPDNYEAALQRLDEVVAKAKTLTGAERAAFLQAHRSDRDALAAFLPENHTTHRQTPDTIPAPQPPSLETPPSEAPTPPVTPAPEAKEAPVTSPEKNSYEGGWGFFNDGNALNPKEYQVTANDDLWVAQLVGEVPKTPDKKHRPLTPEQKAFANAGTAKAAAMILGLNERDTPYTMRDIRDHISKLSLDPAYQDRRKLLKAHGRDVHYQGLRARPGTSLNDLMEDGWQYKKSDGSMGQGRLGVDFLHFGRPSRIEDSADKLDEIMRVYVYAKPEYAGPIAAAVIKQVHEKTGHYLYGKLWDVSTYDDTTLRDDNLLFYVQRHSDMAAVAEVLRAIAAARPDAFDIDARPTDRARKTDIPGVALAEEPVQIPDAPRESFNSHRDDMSMAINKELFKTIGSDPDLQRQYPNEDFAALTSYQYSFEQFIRKHYAALDEAGKTELRNKLKKAYRAAAQKVSPDHHVSTENFAMNARSAIEAKEAEASPDALQFPSSFQEARRYTGNAITNIINALNGDNDDLEFSSGNRIHSTPFDRYVASHQRRAPSASEVDFMKMRTPENVADYDAALVAFTNQCIQNNPYEDQRRSWHEHTYWFQHDSQPFIKDRIENNTHDQPTARIYLSPQYGMEMFEIYKEIFTKAEQAGLRFCAKVYDPSIRGNTKRIEGYKQRYKFDSVRTDPMVFYPYDESKDALLKIASEVYESHRPAFEGTRTGAIPIEIAPGFAVGSEPKGYSGQASLTSHRERVFTHACWNASKDPLWQTAPRDLRLKLLNTYMHEEAIKNNVDPANIAFDLS